MSAIKRKLEVVTEEDGGLLFKVAFASEDQQRVNQHFGSARAFVIYGISPEDKQLLVISEFSDLNQDVNEDKLAEKLALLEGCIAVYCRACGASAVKKLLAKGIQPVKVSEGAEINELIGALQDELKQGPSAWLAKAVSQNGLDKSRFDEMEMEGWDE